MSPSPDQIIAQDSFKEFKATNYPTLTDDEAFERFGMHVLLKQYGVSPADVDAGLVSGSNDGGIDGFYLFLNKHELVAADSIRLSRRKNSLQGIGTGVPLDVVVVQAKKELNWDTNVFPKIQSALTAIFDTSQTSSDLRAFPLNEDVVEKSKTWRDLRSKLSMQVPVVNFYVYYATFARQDSINSYMKTKMRQLKQWLTDNLATGSTATVEYVGDAELVTRLRDGTDFKAKLVLSKTPIRDANALVGLVSIKNYLKFLRHEGGSKNIREEMFAVNVRDYAGSNVRVNDAIGKTLANDSGTLFWWLNNGITIIADEANDPVELQWVLKNPLIVNGLQTSHVLHEQELAGAITRKRSTQSVLVRVITESDPVVRESIIMGTNNQTAIASLQLHANEEKQVRIEEFLRASGWYYERRRHQYRGQKVPAGRIRNVTQVGQAVMAYRLLQPDTARARPTTLLGSSTGWKNVFDAVVPEDLYLKALVVLEKIDDFLRSPDAKKTADDSTNARFYLVAGYSLKASGVKKVEDYFKIPIASLKKAPTKAMLIELHTALYSAVGKLDDGKSAKDVLFKGAELKSEFFDRVVNPGTV